MDSNQNRLRRYEKAGRVTDDIVRRARVMQAVKGVLAVREEVLKAFIAKHGFEPDQCVQIEERQPDGTSRWYMRKFTDQELENIKVGKASQQK